LREIGFEKEYFLVRKNGKLEDPREHGFPVDDSGYLVEARGKPSSDYYQAVFNLLLEEKKLKDFARKIGLKLVAKPNRKFSLKQALKFFQGFKPKDRNNIYGKELPEDFFRKTAGLHVHFSEKEPQLFEYEILENSKPVTKHFKYFQYQQLDIPNLVRQLDKAFRKEIKRAKRIEGEYRIKKHGFEYRSLPNDVNIWKVLRVINKIFPSSPV